MFKKKQNKKKISMQFLFPVDANRKKETGEWKYHIPAVRSLKYCYMFIVTFTIKETPEFLNIFC